MDDISERCTAHLECPFCRYDLFGLATDEYVIRCPECGNRTNIEVLQAPFIERERRTRSLESLLSIAALWPFVLVGWEFILAMVWLRSRHYPEEAMSPWTCAFLATPPLLIWIGLIVAYVRRFRAVTGAKVLLPLFTVCGWLLTVGFCLCLSGSCYLAAEFRESILAIAVGGLLLSFGWRLYARARGVLRQIHHQLAAGKAVRETEPTSHVATPDAPSAILQTSVDIAAGRCSTHIQCPECGYDLFGLPAEEYVVRCPECGKTGDVRTIREEALAKRVRKSLNLAGWCVTTTILVLTCVTVCCAYPTPRVVVGVGLSAGTWVVTRIRFRQHHRHMPKAGLTLLMYHAGVFMVPMGVAALIWGAWSMTRIAPWGFPGPFGNVATGMLMFWAGRWLVIKASGQLHDYHDSQLR